MIDRIQLLRNVGQFDNVAAGAQLPFTKLTLVYAENGRGKTTLAAILRSAATNDAGLVTCRQRLGAAHAPHVVLETTAGPIVFQDEHWSAPLPEVVVFDDAFVAANVCSGIEIDSAHRQNLHELILGAQGVALNATLQAHVARIEEHIRALRQREGAIPAAVRGGLSVDEFCALPAQIDIEAAITTAERGLAAAQASEEIRRQQLFTAFDLPALDKDAINGILGRTLPELEAAAANRVREHLQNLGRDGEAWAAEGMAKIPAASQGHEHSVCPFCAQDLAGSPLIRHYQAYFSEAYDGLKAAITELGRGVAAAHGGDVPAAFERWVRVAVQGREFWRAFTDVPEIDIDTAAVVRDWNAAREAVLNILRAKAAAPLDAAALTENDIALIDTYHARRDIIQTLSRTLLARNGAIEVVKEQAAAANVGAVQADLARLRSTQARYAEPLTEACQAYLDEKIAKAVTEDLRAQARDALDNYRNNIFPAYEAAINDYLQRFNAGFRLIAMGSVNSRGGSSCNYNVIINNVAVSLTAADGPSFRNTLSAGDRNTLALAFFFASLDQEPQLAQKIVVIDDPMTSLDEHRALTTVQEMRRLQARVSQMSVFSHSKPFLCDLWEGADPTERSAIIIQRDGAGSTLARWDVNQDCITEHDRRHAMVSAYLQAANPDTERQVAEALRPILEAFLRVSYPGVFPPGLLLGQFLGICEQRVGAPNTILTQADIAELRALLPYVNRFHHNTNPAYATEAINDQELLHFCGRVLSFARRG